MGSIITLRDVTAASDHFVKRTAGTHAGFFAPYLRSGMQLLDCGCGPGTISIGIAETIVPGELVGIDLDRQHIELARRHAEDSGISNAHFETANVYQLPYDDHTFDAVFSHALLEHLDKPDAALAEMFRVLKPQGLIGIRTPDHDGNLLWPEDQVLRESMAATTRFLASRGGDASRGKQLREQLVRAGFVDIRMTASYDSYGTPEAVRAWAETYVTALEDPTIIERVVARGLADLETLAQRAAAWRAWAQHPGAFHARAWCEAVGWVGI